MLSFFGIFNSREKAIILWMVIALVLILSKKGIRESLASAIKLFFSPKILLIFVITLIYIFLMILFLFRIQLWNFGLLKDSIYWVLGFAIVLLFNINVAYIEKKFFIKIAYDCFKLIIILEFVVNFYVFDFWVELFFVPFLFIIGCLHAVSETEKKYELINKLLNSILATIGFLYLGYFFINLFLDYHTFINLDTLQSMILPPILTLSFIPFIYLLALYMSYESLFLRLSMFMINKSLLKFTKRQIFVKYRFSFSKLNNFIQNNAYKLHHATDRESILKILNQINTNV